MQLLPAKGSACMGGVIASSTVTQIKNATTIPATTLSAAFLRMTEKTAAPKQVVRRIVAAIQF
jgi:hypothetical protein